MANTFTSLHVHVIFSTKNRERWLTPDVEDDVWRYLRGNLPGTPSATLRTRPSSVECTHDSHLDH